MLWSVSCQLKSKMQQWMQQNMYAIPSPFCLPLCLAKCTTQPHNYDFAKHDWKDEEQTAAHRGLIYDKAAGGSSPNSDALTHLVSLQGVGHPQPMESVHCTYIRVLLLGCTQTQGSNELILVICSLQNMQSFILLHQQWFQPMLLPLLRHVVALAQALKQS